jgi:nucleotide-binding universal stress UspA family protein
LSAATSEANSSLDATKKAMAEAGVQATAVVGEGHAVHDGILRAVESTGADLIVMGSHAAGAGKAGPGQRHPARAGCGAHPVLVVRD